MAEDAKTLSIQTVPIAATAAGNNTLLAAVPGQRWVVKYMVLAFAGAETFQFFSGATAVSGLMNAPAAAGPTPFGAAGEIIMRAASVNQAWVLANTGGADITGWAIVEMTR